ncbi:HAMP domain-containing sensor histidine kinase [Glaciecola sp. KUL10]|uniref:sensor histidine kinase n=1 Tax=Glaciecola sp. (strain KUL10) TaxID=2161813 RepID=UPI000D782A31|nr:HAMP domain-containing sensor histidine kinase [Glaciecola sp. KUL10]GBL03208.1 signal transduction histidine kinase-like protein [Glaciecola sp. KUL10]
MIRFKSLKTRLLIAFGLLSLIICLFFIRLSSLLIETAETNAFQSMLIKEQERLLQQENSEKPSLLQYTVLYKSINSVPQDIRIAMANQHSGSFTTSDGMHYVFRLFKNKENQSVLLMNVGSFTANQYLSQYKSLFLYSISVAAFILCALSSWYLAKLLSRPIELLTKQVKNKATHSQLVIKESNNIEKIYGLDRHDEIGMLANALDDSYTKIESLLVREQNFTRDVSHELRTPITIIKNTLALHEHQYLDAEEFNVLQESTNELEQTVEVLLALARQENLNFKSLKLLPIIEQAVLNLFHKYPDIEFEVDLDINSKVTAHCNAALFGLLSQNLVNNAFYHGGGRKMSIKEVNNELVFENPIVTSSNKTSYRGLGHGQYLVKRIAEQMNWKVNIVKNGQVYKVAFLIK